MADRLEECAYHFLGAALRDLAVIDTDDTPQAMLGADLRLLAAGLVAPKAGAAANTLADPMPRPALPNPSPSRAPIRRPAAAGGLN
jgi:hypothetical protein